MHWAWLGAFLVVGLVTIWTGVKDRQNADLSQNNMQTTVQGLKDSIEKLTVPVSAQPSAEGSRDPDEIYQIGSSVGKVTGARITPNESKIYFAEIDNTGNLDRSKTFEYRDYVIRLVSAQSYVGMLIGPAGVATNVYQNAVCEIVGRSH